ncbi:glycerol kinase [Vibrio sp. Isolate25]|uniref:glycerol kinase n=1 Tax=Vibrio TaxID=662 RepID=UPI001EFC7F94|nr:MULTISPECIES: glycerol kinase [Vibrio]MCG9595336.1 glycerol kinase [Vibrio sp. Isolate25]MCG9677638.1 glycerol kinase [Vibrio sp. Isolate24]USD34500.1 glycerol kinase [Vibrio sp. SCSIO 43186]USD47568.1 glycerol kinase [Vibrio sp. SCSIO 43145]USD71625.1 glycerol kinase [Vibrio sp. SCSIO 43139]
MNKISTTALAKLREIEPKQLFQDLKLAGYINRSDEAWVLTELGRTFGGEYAQHQKFGQFIIWPENLLINTVATSGKPLSATQIGERFSLSAKKINQLLQELGWLQKMDTGWEVTANGLKVGGYQRHDKESGNHFAVWHDSIVRNKRLKQSVIEFSGLDAEAHATDKSISSFRQKFEAKHRTLDGHYVRSKGELKIDNWLYMNGIVHAYDRQLPIDEDVLSDFYLPTGKVYLQFWGRDNGDFPENKKADIKRIYHEHQFDLIEVMPEDIDHLDDVLPAKLREFGITAY